MRRHLAALTVVAGMLAAPSAAPAKEISKVAVCGKGGQCTTYDKSDFKSLMFLAEDAGPADPPKAGAPWYRIRFTMTHTGEASHWSVAYVPSANSIRARDEGGRPAWLALNPRPARVLARAAGTLAALPAKQLRGLHAKPLQARVDEVYAPAATHETTVSGATPWGWIAGGAIASVLIATMAARALRRRRRMEPAPT